MDTVFALASVVVLACLLLATGMYPPKSIFSLSELKRRRKDSKSYALELNRYKVHEGLLTLIQAARSVLIVTFAWLTVAWLGWLWGVVVTLAIALAHTGIARILFLRRASEMLYARIEPSLIDFVDKFRSLVYSLIEPSLAAPQPTRRAHSKEDLAEIINKSTDVIEENERKLISAAFNFFDRPISEIMTPRKEIDFIQHSEFLGPLALDELHNLGHSRLPVVAKDLDSIVGILHLEDVVSLDVKRSATAEKTMRKKVVYIDNNDNLEKSLELLIANKETIAIVTNQTGQTVGLVTMSRLIEELIGRPIVTTEDNLLK